MPLHRIHMQVLQLLNELLLTPYIKIVEARLPELRQAMVGLLEAKSQLLCGRTSARCAAQPPRHALLQDLQYRRGCSRDRLTDEQMNMLGHDDISGQSKAVAVAHLTQNLDKGVSCAHGAQQRQAPVATEGNKMQVTLAVAACQSFGHQHSDQKPRPCPQERTRTGHPQTRFVNSALTYWSGIMPSWCAVKRKRKAGPLARICKFCL